MAKKVAKKLSEKASTPTSGGGAQAAPSPEASAQEAPKAPEAEPATASAPDITPDQQAAVDQVFADAKKAAEAILGGGFLPVGIPSGNIEERQENVQRDYIRGTRRKDKTYVPETIYDDRPMGGGTRKVLDYGRYRYAMVSEDSFASYITLNGWKFVKYDGGGRSGLLGDGFQGTGDSVFMRDIRGYCRRGDVYLLYTEIENWLEMKEEDRLRAEKSIENPIGNFFNTAYSKGIRTWADISDQDGVVKRYE